MLFPLVDLDFEYPQLLELPLVPHLRTGVQCPAHRNKLRRFSLKVSLKYDILPGALFLKGVVSTDTESAAIGGFSDIYCGLYEGVVVAIKRLRVYIAAPETLKIKLKQTFCRESMLWKHLCHRHILPFLGVADDIFRHPALCMVMPWKGKGSIRHYIDHLQRRNELSGKRHEESVNEWVRVVTPAGLS